MGAAREEILLLSAAETQQMLTAGVEQRAEGDVTAVREENQFPP